MAFGVTRNLAGNWMYQDQYVERVLDNASYTFAHPDNTLVLAGPPRLETVSQDATSGFNSLIAVGVLQNIQVSQTKPTQPFMAIGSGRTFFLSGKAAGQARVTRFLCNGRNLLRVLLHNAVEAGLNPADFDDPAVHPQSSGGNYQFFANLDSELFLIPLGLCVVFHDKAHNPIGGFYIELCMITSWVINVAAGQSFIMEDVTLMYDRLLPYNAGVKWVGDDEGRPGQSNLDKAITDANLGWQDGVYDIGASTDNLG